MEQNTEASQACPKNFGHPHDYSLREDGKCAYCQHDEEEVQVLNELVPFPPMPSPPGGYAASVRFDRAAMKQYALLYAGLVVAALKAQPAPTEAQSEDSARLDAALIKAREWIVKNRPALTLSRAKTIDEYMGLLDTIDRARASAETGGVKP